MTNETKSENRWLVVQLLIAVNLVLLGMSFYMDATNINSVAFNYAMNGFQAFSGFILSINYVTKTGGGVK